ncbi:hypothetical protein SDC9_156027 [bioreactor metagenome]|uniref:Uncharacterized protein n=1 Tax=bioreactor metagenome TaxID=1076179 RepID=A0A645F5E7_9ZZZZ
MVDGLNAIAQKSVISARWANPSPTSLYPAGVCIQELAIKIHKALKCAPNATSIVEIKCVLGFTLFQPNSKTARKVDSKKKANTASAASGEPKTSPT